jgi:hypothetical protein
MAALDQSPPINCSIVQEKIGNCLQLRRSAFGDPLPVA